MRKEVKTLCAKCAHCHDEIVVSHPGEYKACKCGRISLDAGDGYYYRMGGTPSDFDKEYDREHGIDRFAGFDIPDKNKDVDTVMVSLAPDATDTIFGVNVLPMDVLVRKVWDWFDEKGLSDSVMQMVKVQEEIGELAHEISRGHRTNREVFDALGDSFVTLIGMCHHLNINPEDALSLAWSEIKDRKGEVIDGSFVKCE